MPPPNGSPPPCDQHGKGQVSSWIECRHDSNVGRAPQTLWPFQAEVVARIAAARAAGRRRLLLVAPTASGKTVIIADIIRAAAMAGERTLFLAHRRELLSQASAKLYAVGIDHGIIAPEFPSRPGERVQVASIPTLHARAVRSSRIELPPADILVIDETHHCRARTYRKIIEAYPDAVLIGMTATPCRGDGRGLGNVFQEIVEAPSVAELISGGYLVPAKYFAPYRPDLKGVRVERGDYVERQLAERMDIGTLVGDIVTHWIKLSERRRTVVFATGVAHSVHIRDEFRRAGIMAEHIDGSTPIKERDAILAQLAAGKIEIVTNAMVLTEGWDSPSVSCLVLARPTKSLGLYIQMTGRVLRRSPGKTDALILDHAGAVFHHGFVDDPIIWTLDEDKRAENRAHASRGGHERPGLTTCPECKAVRFRSQPCPVCGWRPKPKPGAVDVEDGDLVHVDRHRRGSMRADEAAQYRFYRQLIWICDDRGYERGWAWHKFQERYGNWPNYRNPQPLPPDDATRAWVRSRQIAYARAMARRRQESGS